MSELSCRPEEVVVARENTDSSSLQDLAVNRTRVAHFLGKEDFPLEIFRVVAPVGLYAEATNRAFPKPFSKGYNIG